MAACHRFGLIGLDSDDQHVVAPSIVSNMRFLEGVGQRGCRKGCYRGEVLVRVQEGLLQEGGTYGVDDGGGTGRG